MYIYNIYIYMGRGAHVAHALALSEGKASLSLGSDDLCTKCFSHVPLSHGMLPFRNGTTASDVHRLSIQIYILNSSSKRSFRGPGGVGRGVDLRNWPKLVRGSWPLCPPPWPPRAFHHHPPPPTTIYHHPPPMIDMDLRQIRPSYD